MTLLLFLLFQEKIEMKDAASFYLLHKPAAYSDAKAWPVILDVGGKGRPTEESLARWKAGGGKEAYLIVVPERKAMGKERESAFVRACLEDVKSRLRCDPERVLLTGQGAEANFAAALCASDPELYAGCASLGLSQAPNVDRKMPPFHVVTRRGDQAGRDAASALAGSGVDVMARPGFDPAAADEPKVLEWFSAKAASRADLETADRFLESRRYLDAWVVCLGLLDRQDQERSVRARFLKIEAAGIMALGSVEVAVAEGKYLDAWLRCRAAATQFSWVPVGEKIRKRLGTLESDARVKKARGTED